MKLFKNIIYLLLTIILISCNNKTRNATPQDTKKELIIGGGCDGCEIMYEGMPKDLKAIDTSDGWQEKGQKLVIEGTVFKPDGKTKAPNVIIYYWQTDTAGLYSKTKEENTIHGHLRGWLQSDTNGNYKIYTVRPASYPNSSIPAHIHFAIKEPKLNEYYIEDLLFEDDPHLTKVERQKLEQRGGNGIAKTSTVNNVQYARRDIILGKNIPDYPKP
ncbi:MAG: intradiol ring-cleavage dioxygenase [Flavobacterium sp.]|uniref:dioxygenase family protein n=1 Tax=unclassified Flavobacterium TaxID=196869 RepID=UPI000EB143ED|nr:MULTISPECIES: intradiol ring-cleavage dioxygenase [unclassified Flavobacterium]MBA4135521.1 intradiol ring-cleavage dioxygenase [Flavobacterium sp.]RKS03449.1 protocatechuate 3,4-dioxygenase beta subunit [Flavobacterium sp. 102]